MLSIRLTRTGKKKQPNYRVVVMEKSKDPWANYIEKLGHYNPRSKELVLNKERILYWLDKGAEATRTVHNFLVSENIIKDDKKQVSHISKKRASKIADKKAEEEAKKKEAEEAAKLAEEEAKAKEAEEKTEEVKEEANNEETTEEKAE